MSTDPVEDFGETKNLLGERAVDEIVPFHTTHIDVETASAEKDVSGGESDSLVAVEESVIIGKGFHQRSCLFLDRVVIAGLRTEDGGLHFAFVADAVQAAEHLDQQLLRRVDLCDRQYSVIYLARRSNRSRLRATDS